MPLNNDQRAALGPLRRSLDAYGDLLVAEAVYHVVSGRSEVAGAAMDAATGLTALPDLEVISTQRTGRGVNTNVVVALPEVDELPLPRGCPTPSEDARSVLDGHLAAVCFMRIRGWAGSHGVSSLLHGAIQTGHTSKPRKQKE